MKIWYTSLLFFADGFTLSPNLIIINKKCKGDQALVAHEQTHVRQMQRDGKWTMRWRYVTSKNWRLAYELEAYRESVRVDPRPQLYAKYLTDEYGLGLSYEDAVALLSELQE